MAGGVGQDPEGTGRKLLTVRVEDCDRPGLLAGVVGVDLFGLAEADGEGPAAAHGVGGDRGPGQAGGRAGVSRARAGRCRARPGSRGRCRRCGRSRRGTRISPAGTRTWTQLARALAAGSAVTVHSVHGLGGVGKTQLATEYAHAHAADYDLVWWIAAEEPASIPDQFAALAVRLGLDPAADPEALRRSGARPAAQRAGLAADLR